MIHCRPLQIKKDIDKYINKSIITYSILDKNASAYSELQKIQNNLTYFSFHYKNKIHHFTTNIIWQHNMLNITGLITFMFDQNLSEEKLQDKLNSLKLPVRTWEIIILKSWLKVIDDSYNISYEWIISWVEQLSYYKWEKILILDEPSVYLDPPNKIRLKEWLIEQNQEFQTTILIASNDPWLISEMCDEILFFRNKTIERIHKSEVMMEKTSWNWSYTWKKSIIIGMASIQLLN